jgi:hypothetical protein
MIQKKRTYGSANVLFAELYCQTSNSTSTNKGLDAATLKNRPWPSANALRTLHQTLDVIKMYDKSKTLRKMGKIKSNAFRSESWLLSCRASHWAGRNRDTTRDIIVNILKGWYTLLCRTAVTHFSHLRNSGFIVYAQSES